MSEYSREEMRSMVLDHLRGMVDYWDGLDVPRREALNGLAFSFLVMLDGHAGMLPAFALVPLPHEDDERDAKVAAGGWWPCPRGAELETIEARDIIGADLLHDAWYSAKNTAT